MKTCNQGDKILQFEIYKVQPSEIDKSLFWKEEREDKREENIRKLILESLEEKEKETYRESFYMIIPRQNWSYKTAEELRMMANKLGDHLARLDEWALYIAQRISKGETWREAQQTESNILIEWKDEELMTISNAFIGMAEIGIRATGEVAYGKTERYYEPKCTVPMIVLYRK